MVWQRPCPVVATIHDLAPFHVPGKYDWLRMTYARTFVRYLSRRQDAVIAISQTTARDIDRFFGRPLNSIDVVPNGLDHDRLAPCDQAPARRLVSDRHTLDKPFFVYVSRLEHPGKNHVRLITAFNNFKAATSSPWQLVFAGGDWHGSEIIHGAIRQSPFASDIRALGFVPSEDIPLLYQAAGACVYPSLFEGFGMPPLEAMACGCPVISSNRGSLAEVVADAAITLDPVDLKAWKREMLRISSDETLRSGLRAKGLARAAQFDWHKTAAATLDVYERTISRVGARRLFRASLPKAREMQPASARSVTL
jgi:glycosyltransferase involved in cell wall biosynthesis